MLRTERRLELERVGRERALLYKTLVLTGLWKSALASITIGQVRLDAVPPHIELQAADERAAVVTSDPLLYVPSGLIRILDCDLEAATIPKVDDRGRTLDVHALRTTFGTLMSMVGVQPRATKTAGCPLRTIGRRRSG